MTLIINNQEVEKVLTMEDTMAALEKSYLDLASGDGGHSMRPAGNGVVMHGLPTTGFEAYNIINANAQPGLLANYGGLFRHRASRSCTGADPACS